MKIRNDFVTNSSSTSFILSTKKDLKKELFLKQLGINDSSKMISIFEELFQVIEDKKVEINEYVEKYESGLSIKEFLSGNRYSEEDISIIINRIENNENVYFGYLSSDGETIGERYFCTESFVICKEDIYLNAKIGGW